MKYPQPSPPVRLREWVGLRWRIRLRRDAAPHEPCHIAAVEAIWHADDLKLTKAGKHVVDSPVGSDKTFRRASGPTGIEGENHDVTLSWPYLHLRRCGDTHRQRKKE